MTPMKIHTSFTIQLIRDSNDSTRDDTITIRKTEYDNLVSLCYKDRFSNSQHEVFVEKSSASEYCISLFHVLSYDNDPFKHVQVNFPAFPSVLLDASDLQYESLRERLQSMLWFTLDKSFAV
jgi:hypothetical protein